MYFKGLHAKEWQKIMKERDKWKDFLLPYKFKLDELKTKVNIINEEKYMDGYNPIEHIKCPSF